MPISSFSTENIVHRGQGCQRQTALRHQMLGYSVIPVSDGLVSPFPTPGGDGPSKVLIFVVLIIRY
jgi:hypothetical protein